jgi:hypothetical protein
MPIILKKIVHTYFKATKSPSLHSRDTFSNPHACQLTSASGRIMLGFGPKFISNILSQPFFFKKKEKGE